MPDMPALPIPTMCTRCSSGGNGRAPLIGMPSFGDLKDHLGDPAGGVAVADLGGRGRHRRQSRRIGE